MKIKYIAIPLLLLSTLSANASVDLRWDPEQGSKQCQIDLADMTAYIEKYGKIVREIAMFSPPRVVSFQIKDNKCHGQYYGGGFAGWNPFNWTPGLWSETLQYGD